MVSRNVINPLHPRKDPLTERPNNPTFCPITGEAVYKFLMTDPRLPTIGLNNKNNGVRGNCV